MFLLCLCWPFITADSSWCLNSTFSKLMHSVYSFWCYIILNHLSFSLYKLTYLQPHFLSRGNRVSGANRVSFIVNQLLFIFLRVSMFRKRQKRIPALQILNNGFEGALTIANLLLNYRRKQWRLFTQTTPWPFTVLKWKCTFGREETPGHDVWIADFHNNKTNVLFLIERADLKTY